MRFQTFWKQRPYHRIDGPPERTPQPARANTLPNTAQHQSWSEPRLSKCQHRQLAKVPCSAIRQEGLDRVYPMQASARESDCLRFRGKPLTYEMTGKRVVWSLMRTLVP